MEEFYKALELSLLIGSIGVGITLFLIYIHFPEQEAVFNIDGNRTGELIISKKYKHKFKKILVGHNTIKLNFGFFANYGILYSEKDNFGFIIERTYPIEKLKSNDLIVVRRGKSVIIVKVVVPGKVLISVKESYCTVNHNNILNRDIYINHIHFDTYLGKIDSIKKLKLINI